MKHALNVLAVIGSPRAQSVTRVVVRELAAQLRAAGCSVDVLDLGETQIPPYNPDTSYGAPGFPALKARVLQADALILGSPDYHGCISSTLKNFLDHFWTELSGKLIAPVVASHEKGLTVVDQLRTVTRQCYAWALPYAVTLAENHDVKDGKIVTDALAARVRMMARDVRVYGGLLAGQRAADLAGTEACFLEKLRKPA
jgi:NAD(P)H-dependent FMN reductase